MLDLLDYRRRVTEMYHFIREHGTDAPESCSTFRATRDDLFALHAQSPLTPEQRDRFVGLRYHDYDPAYRVVVPLDTKVEAKRFSLDLGEDGTAILRLFARVNFELPNGAGSLGVYWIEGYGGGVFMPFRDATNGQESYGGGRYLYDTIKGADLGATRNSVVLDFNYAYHPSCAYNPAYVCPLAPPQNALDFRVEAGEMLPEGL